MNPLFLHINYFEKGSSLRGACRLAGEVGANGMEFRRRPAPSHFEGDDLAYLDELTRALDEFPLTSVSFGSPDVNLMLADDNARAAELEAAKRFYRAAVKRFPVHRVNVQTGVLMNPASTVPGAAYDQHGSAVATERVWEQAIEGLRELTSLGEEIGIQFALETHPCYLHDTVAASIRLVDAVNHPALGILWDHTNLLLFPNPPSIADSLTEIGPRLSYVHMKNFMQAPVNGSFLIGALSDGIVDVREQARRLVENGYSGAICIESPREGDREWFAKQDFNYLRSLMEDIHHMA